MELCFRVKISGGGETIMEFPISTPTKVTKAVLRASNTKERLEILEDMMHLDDTTLSEIEEMLHNPSLKLSEI